MDNFDENNNRLRVLSFAKLIGKGYGNGWFKNCHCRYRVFAGARNTKKSYVIIGLEVLCKILSDPRRNVLIIRNVAGSNKNSTFAVITRLIDTPDINNPEISLTSEFNINNSTMRITYKKTGQVIIFDGMSNPEKITSTTVRHGYLTDVYVEEASEITDYDAWRKVDGTIRGDLPDGLFHQITFCLNPWDNDSWIYSHFFKDRLEDNLEYMMHHTYMDYKNENLYIDYGKGLYLHKSNYKINEFRDKDIYDNAMEQLKENAPEIWKVEAMGMWGNTQGATYPELITGIDKIVQPPQIVNTMPYSRYAIGIDTGLSDGQGKVSKNDKIKSATTMVLSGLSEDCQKLCAIDEYFYSNEKQLISKGAPEIMEEIILKLQMWQDKFRCDDVLMQGIVPIYVDNADIGFRQGLTYLANSKGLYNFKFMPSTKIPIHIRVRYIRLIMGFSELVISKNCKNLIRELKSARGGKKNKVREDGNDHAINGWEYSWVSLYKRQIRYSSFKAN